MYNLMFQRENDAVVGILIDFDQAIAVPHTPATSRHRTGTAPFMAIEMLRDANTIHELHHDLESFLYVLVWHSCGYRGKEKAGTAGDPLGGWRKGSNKDIAKSKGAFILILDNWRESLLPGKLRTKSMLLLRTYVERENQLEHSKMIALIAEATAESAAPLQTVQQITYENFMAAVQEEQ